MHPHLSCLDSTTASNNCSFNKSYLYSLHFNRNQLFILQSWNFDNLFIEQCSVQNGPSRLPVLKHCFQPRFQQTFGQPSVFNLLPPMLAFYRN